jgi:hypothetical protein
MQTNKQTNQPTDAPSMRLSNKTTSLAGFDNQGVFLVGEKLVSLSGV